MNTQQGAPAPDPATTQPTNLADALARMQSQGGTLTAEITVTRAGTGQVEKHTLVLTPAKEA